MYRQVFWILWAEPMPMFPQCLPRAKPEAKQGTLRAGAVEKQKGTIKQRQKNGSKSTSKSTRSNIWGRPVFVTFTCHRWLPLFEETKLYDNLYNWFRILNEQEIKVIGYVFMRNAARPNHLHCLIYLPKDAPELYGNAKLKLSAMPKDLWRMKL